MGADALVKAWPVQRAARRVGVGSAPPRPAVALPHRLAEHVPVSVGFQAVAVGGRELVVAAPTDPEAVEDMHGVLQEPVDGVWSELWPSARAAAELVAAEPALVAGRDVADLGAGIGVAGLAAALAGARSVSLLDREVRALWCGLAAARANGLAAEPLPPDTRTLDGDALPPLPIADGAGATVRAERLDWDEPQEAWPSPGAFDTVLAADVLYQQESVRSVARVAAHLLRPGGRILLTDTLWRRGKEGLRDAFLEELCALAPRGAPPLRVLRRGRLVVKMPAPVLDSNTGGEHPVEWALFGSETAGGSA